ncbi:MAG: dihydrolipoyl dehydrogenase [Planctomycetes bacterium]|nr:dihydrolipoyl dehydrogenase [Planctomycetota bacterium]
MPDENIYDVAVIGGGPGGYVAALRAALRGAKVALVEKNLLGGTCLNVGCIPSKAMLRASELCWSARKAGEFGLTGSLGVDGPAFMARVGKTVGILRKGIEGLLKARNVDVVAGRGKLAGPNSIEVESGTTKQQIRAKSIILAAGSRPARSAIFPWDDARVQTTDEALTATDLPQSVLIVGGGVIGCELATVFSELGITTTVIEMLDRLVSVLDEDVSRVITRSLQKRSATVLTGARIVACEAKDDAITCRLEDSQVLAAQRVIVAVGRKPNIDDLGLEAAGVKTDGGIIPVDDRCRTNVENIYAVGDIAERLQYAHLAHRMGIVAADNATGQPARDDRSVVPAGMYTHPEVATVGLTQSQATQKGIQAKAAAFPYQASGMARAHGETDGSIKLLAAPDGLLLGATVIGPHATDVIQEIALAIRHKMKVADVAETIHAHPTFCEGLLEAADAWLGLPIHTLK